MQIQFIWKLKLLCQENYCIQDLTDRRGSLCFAAERDCSDIDLSVDHCRLHFRRVGAVRAVGRVGLLDRVLLLLRHAVDDRVRRHRARHRAERVGRRREARLLRRLAGVRIVAARHVLQPDAGGGQGEVRMVRPQTRSAQKRRRRRRLIRSVASTSSRARKLEASTHKSAKTHAGNVFVTRNLDL